MIINQKTHPHFWENHPPASPILRIMGVHVDQGKYEEFLKEAESCCPHLNEEEKKTWAAFNSMHHKGTRAGHIAEIPGTKVVRLSRWLERAIAAILIYLAVILLLLVVLVARGHAQTNQGPTPTITNLGNGHRAMDMTCPPGATCGGGGGGGTSATDNTGFTAGTSVFTPAGGVFNNVLAALSSGNWGTFRITAFRALQV